MLQKHHNHQKLGQFLATAICGNDILGSTLYVAGIAAIFAGIYAPLILLMVGGVLLLYKSVYQEVVEALPINGGVYNALLNSTTKIIAAIAGTITILSYTATAVISSKIGIEYLFKFLAETISLHNSPALILSGVFIVLLLFAILVVMGVKDSAKIAGVIFGFHILTLITFIAAGIIYTIYHGFDVSIINWQKTKLLIAQHDNLFETIFLAFSISLLGISGFESSANFVEEQKKGIFRKTLKNMAIGVIIFNPLIAAISLNILPLKEIFAAKDFLLASVAFKIGGLFFLGLIAIDAFLVLCGAVLTSYIGISGLVYRMALDQALPKFLATTNKNGAHPRIIFIFLTLCTSILLLTKGNLLSLAGVYTISFLGVMTLFAISNLILRHTRPKLKRTYRAPLLVVICAAITTIIGLLGNIAIDIQNIIYFLIYFISILFIVFISIFQAEFFHNLKRIFSFSAVFYDYWHKKQIRAEETQFYVFLHHTKNLFRALEYINHNENGHHVTIVYCSDDDNREREDIETIIPILKKAGVLNRLQVQFKYLEKKFSPKVVREFAKNQKIPLNNIFIGSIRDYHEFDYKDFTGVRIIFE